MSPGRASAAARDDELAAPRPAPGPRLRPAESQPGRLARMGAVLRSGNLIGRIGTLTAVALFVAVFGVVVFQAFLVQGQARLDHLNGQIASERETSKQLQLQLAQLDSPSRIVTAARALGMIDAGDIVYLQPAASDDAAARYTAPATQTTPTTATTTPTTASPPTTAGSTTSATTTGSTNASSTGSPARSGRP